MAPTEKAARLPNDVRFVLAGLVVMLGGKFPVKVATTLVTAP